MNIYKFALKTLIVIATWGTIAAIHAAPVTYNFGGSGGTAGSYVFSAGGVSVTVTATSWDGSAWRTASVGRYSEGLGVSNSSGWDANSPQHATDNNGWDDYLVFQFSEPVDVGSVYLGWVSNDSDFRYWIGNTQSDVRTTAGGTGVSGGSSPNLYNINGGDLTGTYFSIAASLTSSNDYFKVKKLTFERVPSVPDEGATAALLGLGLLGVLALRRRGSA